MSPELKSGIETAELATLVDRLLQAAPELASLVRCLTDGYVETLQSLLDDYVQAS